MLLPAPLSLLLGISLSTTLVAAQAPPSDPFAIASQIPACALGCIGQGASTSGCREDDFACQCTNLARIQTSIQSCLNEACTAQEITGTDPVLALFGLVTCKG